MDTEEILTRAKVAEKERPTSWIVFPLQRKKLMLGIAGWVTGIILGGGLFSLVALIVIPINYLHGWFTASITTCLLAVLLFLALGSMWVLIVDVQRLRRSDKHLLIITLEDFVKQEDRRIIRVPLRYVRHITTRGLPEAERASVLQSEQRGDIRAMGTYVSFLGKRGGNRRQRKRRALSPKVAFLDGRTDTEVIVLTDEAYGNPRLIATSLQERVTLAQSMTS